MPTPNVVKYGTSSEANSIKKNNVILGINNVDYAPTSTTNYWNGITPPVSNGYTIYSVPSGTTTPSIVCPSNTTALMYFANSFGGSNITNQTSALNYLTTGLTNSIVCNIDYGNVVTSGITMLIDGGFTPSYPRVGSTIYDLSSNSNNGTLVNTPTYTGNSVGGSINFISTSSQYITFGNTHNFTTSDFSFSFWVTFTSLTTNTTGVGPFIFNKGTASTNGYSCQVSTGGTLSFSTSQASATQITSTSASTISVGNWNNITITRSGSSVKIYLNGNDVTYSSGTHVNPTTSSSDFLIATNATTYSNMMISNFMVYNRQLSITEVSQNYSANSNRFSNIFVTGSFSYLNQYYTANIISLDQYGNLNENFFGSGGFNSGVNVVKYQNDGKIIIGGSFSSYYTATVNFIIRLFPNGTVDSSFTTGTGFNGTVSVLEIDSNNKIIVVGSFTSYSGVTANRIIRLNNDGTIDNTFSIGTGFNSYVNALTISNNKILVGGAFSSYNSNTSNLIARLNSDGTFDSSFSAGTNSFGVFEYINTIDFDSNNKVYAAGLISQYSGLTIGNIISFNDDGSLNSTFNNGASTGFNQEVYSISINSNNKIVCGGVFSTYSGASYLRIVRLNTDGSVDNTFSIGSGFGGGVPVFVYTNSNNSVYVGGSFTSYNGQANNSLVLLNNDGTLNTTFSPLNSLNTVVRLDLFGNSLIVGGNISSYGGTFTTRFGAFNQDGSTNTYINAAFNGSTNYGLAKNSKNKIYVVGGFTQYGTSIFINYIMRLNYDGSPDLSWSTGTDDYIVTCVVDSSDNVYIGGNFTQAAAASSPKIAKLRDNGTRDTTFAVGTGFNNTVNILKLDSNNKVLAGGIFTTYKGVTATRVRRLNTDGSADTTFSATSNSSVVSLDVDTNNNVFLGGAFTSINSVTINRIVKLNTLGAIDNTFSVGTGFNAQVYTVKVDSNNKILVGGDFSTYSGATANKIVRLNTDGSIDNTFSTGTGFNALVRYINIYNGIIYVGGGFTNYNGINVRSIVALNSDGTINSTINFNYGAAPSIYSIVV